MTLYCMLPINNYHSSNAPPMDNELECPLCSSEYSQDNIPRLLTACGHTFCHQCLDTLIIEEEDSYRIECPEDQTVVHLASNEITQFPKNIALLKLIDAKRAHMSGESFKDESLEITKIAKNDNSRGNESEADIISEIRSEEKMESKEEEQQQKGSALMTEPEICLMHQKPLEVVCLVDLCKICSKCAIFGDHKGHEFKSLEQIDQECNGFRENLLQIQREKEEIEKHWEDEENTEEIMSVLETRKKRLQKDISERYRKLANFVKRAEELTLKRLDEASGKAQEKIRNTLQMDRKLGRQYQEWSSGSLSKFIRMEEGSFQQKLELLYGSNSSFDFLARGSEIVDRMRQREDNLLGDIEVIIESIQLDTSEEIYNHVDSFAVIRYEEPIERAEEHNQERADIIKPSGLNHHPNHTPSSPTAMPSPEDFLLETEYGEKVESSQLLSEPAASIVEPPSHIPVSLMSHQEPIKMERRSPNLNKNDIGPAQKFEKPSKKKLKSIKVPQKFQKVLQALYNDTLDTLDLTNSEVGDVVILQICQFLRCSKVKVVKFIRCKLSDEAVNRIIPAMGNIITLNLSQNYLTDAVLGRLAARREAMPALKTVILCQNKIIERKHRASIERLRQTDLIVSV